MFKQVPQPIVLRWVVLVRSLPGHGGLLVLAHREGVLFLPEWVATDSGLFRRSQKLCPAQSSLLRSACFSWFWRTLPIRTRGGKRSLLLLCAGGPQTHPGFESSHFIQPFSDVCVECAVLHLPGTRQGGLTETTSIGKKNGLCLFLRKAHALPLYLVHGRSNPICYITTVQPQFSLLQVAMSLHC